MLNLSSQILFLLALLVAVTVHEFAHAWMANRLGDPTPKLQGRLTLNPIAHLDPIGTLLPVILILTGSPFIFGWGKPVQFDPFNLEKPKRDAALISLAGPLTNLSLAAILAIILRISAVPISSAYLLSAILIPIIYLNVILAIFNLIPIHPLDGGKIIVGLLPEKDAHELDKFLRKYGMLILLLLIFPIFGGTSPVSALISPIIRFIVGFLIPSTTLI